MAELSRVLALDVGERRIGVAVSDPTGLLARPLTTIQRQSNVQAVADILALVGEWTPTTVLIGLPRNMDGSLGPQADKVMAFGRKLEPSLGVPIVYWDERLSTVGAAEILHKQGVQAREQRSRVDAVAAAVFLQEYLNAQRGETEAPRLAPPLEEPPADDDTRRDGSRRVKRPRARYAKGRDRDDE